MILLSYSPSRVTLLKWVISLGGLLWNRWVTKLNVILLFCISHSWETLKLCLPCKALHSGMICSTYIDEILYECTVLMQSEYHRPVCNVRSFNVFHASCHFIMSHKWTHQIPRSPVEINSVHKTTILIRFVFTTHHWQNYHKIANWPPEANREYF